MKNNRSSQSTHHITDLPTFLILKGKTLSNENMSITSWDENVLDEYLSSIDINEPFLYDCIAVSIKTYRSYTKNSFFHDPHHNESIYTPIMSEYNRGILENSVRNIFLDFIV